MFWSSQPSDELVLVSCGSTSAGQDSMAPWLTPHRQTANNKGIKFACWAWQAPHLASWIKLFWKTDLPSLVLMLQQRLLNNHQHKATTDFYYHQT
jgi:hypothetical protein